jgi:sterol desaturase/sphingolipid hydroxylase (fatty acid hydroxylase superfamily)
MVSTSLAPDTSRRPSRPSRWADRATVALLAVPSAVIVYSLAENGWDRVGQHVMANVAGLRDYLAAGFFSLPFAGFLVAVLVLEQIRPAAAGQPVLSRGLWFDAGLMFSSLAVDFFITSAGVLLVTLFLAAHSGLSLQAVSAWPNWLRVVLVLVVLDFGSWVSHRLRHRLPWLWRFHAVHHSQREMNLMTEFRLHPIDRLNSSLLQSFTFIILLVPIRQTLACLLLQQYYLMFVHANVDVGYGPLDAVFVSPRVHRIHHSSDAAHHDRNFGAFLTLWDTVFGTRYRGARPVTATGAAGVPDEREGPLAAMPGVYVRQWLWPFRPSGRRPARPT